MTTTHASPEPAETRDEAREPEKRPLINFAKLRQARSFRDVVLRIGKDLRPVVNRILGRDSLVGDHAVFDPLAPDFAAAIPCVGEIEANWQKIQKEALEVLAERERLPSLQDISPDHAKIAGGPGWRSFILHGYGYRRPKACARCPETAQLLERIPGLETAFFSVMEPGQYLKRHRGPTKAILTWHVPLILPDHPEDCQIRIDGENYAWEYGKSLIFDDTYKHEVWNMTGQQRVVLLMHVRRPLRFPGSWVAGFFLWAIKRSPFIQDARRNQDEWDREIEKRLAASAGRDS